jgi:ATP-dependent helicase/nuclease subunit A
VPPVVERTLGLLEELAGGQATDFFSKIEHRISGGLGRAMTRLIGGYLRAEIEARATRTVGLWSLLWAYESIYGTEVRRRGRLGFSDVTRLLADGGLTTDGRARIESRLDARYRQWLLDEFQDTSREQWEVLEGLLDEAMLDPDGERSLFVVGDTKQGIYGWRGGEPRLFDDLLARPGWSGRMHEWGMETSWRSAQEVLDLVNRVCNPVVMRERFPKAAVDRWNYAVHRTAPRSVSLPGYAVVIDTAKDEEDDEDEIGGVDGALRDLLVEVRPIERGLSCAVLVRSNAKARRLVDFLRQEFPDMPVEMDAEVELSQDNPIGVALLDLFRWLAHPSDRLAMGHVMASPLGPAIEGFGDRATSRWHDCRARIVASGMAGLLQEIIVQLRTRGALNRFLEQRLSGIVRAALDYDESGGRDLDEWLRNLQSLKQREYSAEGALQVMTVHKAKGLEFDMVVLPDLAGGAFDDPSKAGILEFKDASGRIEGVLLAPGRKLLEADAALNARFEAWSAEQCYERFCNLYVGLTRAKHASYVLLPKAPANPSSERRFDLWIRSVLGAADGEVNWNAKPHVTLHEAGDASWHEKIRREREESVATPAISPLGPAMVRRTRTSPSAAKKESATIAHSPSGMAFGSEVHSLLEGVGWIDEEPAVLPDSEAGCLCAGLLELPDFRRVFERRGRAVSLLREQPIEAIINGGWLSGVIDRLHIFRDDRGEVSEIEVIDFKTDALARSEELIERYAGQMQAYRNALGMMHPEVKIHCLLISTRLRMVVESPDFTQPG